MPACNQDCLSQDSLKIDQLRALLEKKSHAKIKYGLPHDCYCQLYIGYSIQYSLLDPARCNFAPSIPFIILGHR